MNKRPGARSIARSAAIYLATFTVATALTGVFAGTAAADPEPADPAPTSTAPSTVGTPSSSTAPEPSAPPAESSQPAAPQPQDDPVPQPDLEVTFDFEKKVYRTDEDVRFTIKIKNTRAVPVVGLQVAHFFANPDDLSVPFLGGWGPLGQKPGVTLQPGETFALPVSGLVQDISQDHAILRGFVYDESGHGVAPGFDLPVKLDNSPGRALGVVYGDKNGDGKLDEGEQLSGITLTLRYTNGSKTYTATSGPGGTFDFGAIPAAKYYLGGDVAGGWLIPFQTVQIGPDTPALLVRGALPLNGALKASMAFTQDSYKVGDLAHVTVTLSNSGAIPLVGIVAECNRVGNSYILTGTGPGWGDLVWSRGVTIAAGETRTFDVTETVPEAAFNRGFVAASCDFGYYEVDIDNHAQADDRAVVPGAKAAVVGDVSQVADQGERQGVAGVKVVLTATQDCPVVGEQTTDAKGHFEFHNLVPGLDYQVYLLPPQGWKVKYENPTSVDVYGPEDHPARLGIDVEPGDAPLPTVPTQPPGCGAAGTPTSTTGAAGTGGGESGGGSGLASTGVDALGLGALTLAALGLGAALVFGARRRRRPTD